MGTWEEDWELSELIEHDQPCFLLYRLDERDSSGGCFRWLLLSWSPDHASTRQKMLYASTKATQKGVRPESDQGGNLRQHERGCDPCWLQEAYQGRSGARTFVQGGRGNEGVQRNRGWGRHWC